MLVVLVYVNQIHRIVYDWLEGLLMTFPETLLTVLALEVVVFVYYL